MMTSQEAGSTIATRGSEATRGTIQEEAHVREAGARSVTPVVAHHANGATGATARTIVNIQKERNSLNPPRAECQAMART